MTLYVYIKYCQMKFLEDLPNIRLAKYIIQIAVKNLLINTIP